MANERPIKILTLNIEGDKHLPAVERLLRKEKPDVICVQEIFKRDFFQFQNDLHFRGLFQPTINVDSGGVPGYKERGLMGIAVLGALPGTYRAAQYFRRRQEHVPLYRGVANAGNRALVWHTVENGKNRRTVATTHFTWSKGGKPSQKQRRELASLFRLLDRVKPDVLCGDFNAPRGGEIYSAFSRRFVDNIPPHIKSTLDPKLHYSHGAALVVDGFFTTPSCQVAGLKLIDGVSDHLAIIGIVACGTNLV